MQRITEHLAVHSNIAINSAPSFEGTMFVQWVGKYPPDNMVSHHTRPESLATLLWEPQSLHSTELFTAFRFI